MGRSRRCGRVPRRQVRAWRPGEQVLQLRERARAEDDGRYRRVGQRKGDCQLRKAAAQLAGEGGEFLRRVELALVFRSRGVEPRGVEGGATLGQVGWCPAPVPAGGETPSREACTSARPSGDAGTAAAPTARCHG